MSERYVSWLITCLFITEFRFDAIWVLSWMTKILIHGSCLHGLHFFPGRRFPTPAIWRSVIVSRHVTGEKGAVLPLKCDCKYWTNELKLSRPRKAYSFHQADSWYFANILVLELTFEYCALLMSVVLTRSNSLPPCVFHIGLRCCTIALLGHNVRSWNTLNTFLWDSGKNKVLANITYMAKFGSCLGRHLTSLRPWYHADLLRNHRLHCRGVTREERGHNSPRAESLWGRRITAWGAESPNNITSDFFNAVHLLPKDLRFEHKPCVHWMDCVCLFHKICGYHDKEVSIQLIRSTTRQYFWGRQHGPAWKCIYPKNISTINARNPGNLTKKTSELHERTKIPRKDRIPICSRE